MKLSTKGRYAMVALVDLATSPGRLTTLAAISKRQNISLPYLEQLFVRLRRAGLVESVRASVDEIEQSGSGWTFAKLTIANATIRDLAVAAL